MSKTKAPATIAEIEAQVWELEGVRIVVRAPAQLSVRHAAGYDYARRLAVTATLANLFDRLRNIGLSNTNMQILVFDKYMNPISPDVNPEGWSIARLSTLDVHASKSK